MKNDLITKLRMTKRYFKSLYEEKEKPKIRKMEDLIPIKMVSTKYGEIGFYCAGRICPYRADTFHTKEPETLEWMDTFKEGDVLWDIGANVGVYSLYAALKKVKVFAFEPSSFNYFILMKNIYINRMDGMISALCLAFNDTTVISYLKMEFIEVGDSCHKLIDHERMEEQSETNLHQAVLSMSIDKFIDMYNPPFPTHIKIDVDGCEAGIIKGAKKTISDARLQTILIEINEEEPEDIKIIDVLKGAGFNSFARKHAPQFEKSPIFNYVFTR